MALPKLVSQSLPERLRYQLSEPERDRHTPALLPAMQFARRASIVGKVRDARPVGTPAQTLPTIAVGRACSRNSPVDEYWQDFGPDRPGDDLVAFNEDAQRSVTMLRGHDPRHSVA